MLRIKEVDITRVNSRATLDTQAGRYFHYDQDLATMYVNTKLLPRQVGVATVCIIIYKTI